MRKLYLLIFALFLAGCAPSADVLFGGNTEFHKIDINTKVYYFAYPSGAALKDEQNNRP